MSNDQTPVLIRVTDKHEVSLVEDTERGRELLALFMKNDTLMKVLPAGVYSFNSFRRSETTVLTTCDSVGESIGTFFKLTERGPSTEVSLIVGETKKEDLLLNLFDWKNPWTYFRIIVGSIFWSVLLWAIFSD